MSNSKKKKRIFIPVGTVILVVITALLLHFTTITIVEISESKGLLEDYSNNSILSNESTIKEVEIGEEYGDYSDISKRLSKLKSTHKEWTNYLENPEENGLCCIATEDEGVRMVYNLEPDNLCNSGFSFNDFDYIWVDSVNQGFYCVINVPGELVDLSGYYILVHDDTGNLASRLIINCYEAKALILDNAIITGTILAPNANVQYNGTIVYGGVYAKASTGSRSYYKTIEYGGFGVIFDETVKVSITNYVVRSTIINYLKYKYPETYSSYSDSYVLNNKDLEKVTDLVLDEQLIADLYDDLKYLVNLNSLSVKGTKLKSLDVSFLSNLKYLDISETDISEVMLPLSNSITTFIADWSKLTTLDTTKLTNCTHVSLARVEFVTLPEWENLRSVTYLNITKTGFSGFTQQQVTNLTNLSELYCSENEELTELDLSAFEKLKKLEVKECSLEKIDVTGLLYLTEMDVSYNSFKEIDLSMCESLTKLSAYGEYKKIIVRTENVEVSKLTETKLEILQKTEE